MRPIHAAALAPLLAGAIAIFACQPDSPQPPPAPTSQPSSQPTAQPGTGPTAVPGCKLPAPVKSGDACTTDADCGVSDPCHAKACVAKAKSHPKQPDTMCTMSLDCSSADVNRCGCLEGKCALIPPVN
jgi:hypothetical protein